MKAFLLAAGLGTRLRPITDEVPKCLVTIGGRPLLWYWLRLLEKHGVNEVLINLHHHPEQVERFAASAQTRLKIHLSFEPELLGSAGTVRVNRNWLGADEPFLIAYADNLTNADLTALVDAHRRQPAVATIALALTDVPEQCGVVEMDASNTILSFVEKSPNPPSRLANAGIYVATQRLFDYLPDESPADFGFHVFPRLTGSIKGHLLDGYHRDIGTLANYRQAQSDIQELAF